MLTLPNSQLSSSPPPPPSPPHPPFFSFFFVSVFSTCIFRKHSPLSPTRCAGTIDYAKHLESQEMNHPNGYWSLSMTLSHGHTWASIYRLRDFQQQRGPPPTRHVRLSTSHWHLPWCHLKGTLLVDSVLRPISGYVLPQGDVLQVSTVVRIRERCCVARKVLFSWIKLPLFGREVERRHANTILQTGFVFLQSVVKMARISQPYLTFTIH